MYNCCQHCYLYPAYQYYINIINNYSLPKQLQHNSGNTKPSLSGNKAHYSSKLLIFYCCCFERHVYQLTEISSMEWSLNYKQELLWKPAYCTFNGRNCIADWSVKTGHTITIFSCGFGWDHWQAPLSLPCRFRQRAVSHRHTSLTLAVELLDDLLEHDVGGKGGHSGATQPTIAVRWWAVLAQSMATWDQQHWYVLQGCLQVQSEMSTKQS